MSTPNLKSVQDATESGVSFLEWFVATLKGKNWIKKLVLLDVILITFFNPTVFFYLIKYLGINSLIGLTEFPSEYTFIFWAIIVTIFIVALILVWRSKPLREIRVPDISERRAIKGLRSFSFEDAEIFAKLQREDVLTSSINAIQDNVFRVGILYGESGCGKSSFLQAGLWPMIDSSGGRYKCIYVKFSNIKPLDSIRQAIAQQTTLLLEEIKHLTLNQLFNSTCKAENKTIVFVFDQFEQFFVQYPKVDQRHAFLDALSDWFKNQTSLLVKIIFSLRSDFMDRMFELQKSMGFLLGPQDAFQLSKFTPSQATDIFEAIANSAGLKFDRKFIEEVCQSELANYKDGLISPVDIQILAWMINGYQGQNEKGFNRKVYEQLGGVEGLLENYLSETLSTLILENRKSDTVKILLALTNLESNTRAALMTTEQIDNKIGITINRRELKTSLSWLADSRIRLITAVQQQESFGYELAHEKLIPALRNLADKQLNEVSKANIVFDRRVNEWIGNNMRHRYLLSFREIRLLSRQKGQIVWGPKKEQKLDLINKSKKRIAILTSPFLFVLLLLVGYWIWTLSLDGKIFQLKKSIVSLENRTDVASLHGEIVDAFIITKELNKAYKTSEKMLFSIEKSYAIIRTAFAFEQKGNNTRAIELALEAVEVSGSWIDPFPYGTTHDDEESKIFFIGAVASQIARWGDDVKAEELFEQAILRATDLEDEFLRSDILIEIAYQAAHLSNKDKARNVIEKTLLAANASEDESVRAMAYFKALIQVTQIPNADDSANTMNVGMTFTEIAKEKELRYNGFDKIAYLIISELDDLELTTEYLEFALSVSEYIRVRDRVNTLCKISSLVAKRGDSIKASDLIEKAICTADSVRGGFDRLKAYLKIAAIAANMGQNDKSAMLVSKAITEVDSVDNYDSQKVKSYCAIAVLAAQLGDEDNAIELFNNAFLAANGYFSNLIEGYKIIIKSIMQLGDKAVISLLHKELDKLKSMKRIDAEDLIEMASVLNNNGDQEKAAYFINEAILSAEGEQKLIDKSIGFCKIGFGFAEYGDIKKSLEAYKKAFSIADSVDLITGIEAIIEIVNSAILLKNKNLALKVNEILIKEMAGYDDMFIKSMLSPKIAVIFILNGELNQALKFAYTIDHEETKLATLAFILKSYGEEKYPEWNDKIKSSILNEWSIRDESFFPNF